MSEHKVKIVWKNAAESFDYKSYNREHFWIFENGLKVEASAAPQFLGKENCVDPEEAFTAALSSCHMLTFLALCSRKRWVVESYEDEAIGFLDKNEAGKLFMKRVELHPKIVFSADHSPSKSELDHLHELAHQECFIANSVKSEVLVLF